MGGYGGYGGSYDMGYADNYYNRNRCRYGCPSNSYCRLGFCECNQGLTKIAVMNPSFLTFYMNLPLTSFAFSGCLLPSKSTTNTKTVQLPTIPRLHQLLDLPDRGHEPHLQHQPHNEGRSGPVSVQDQLQVEQCRRGVSGGCFLLDLL